MDYYKMKVKVNVNIFLVLSYYHIILLYYHVQQGLHL